MKAVLISILISLISCQLLGGWTKRSLKENNLYIDRSFNTAIKSYSNDENVDVDDFIRLTVYSQVVAGTNYKVCFLDPKNENPTIQEYVIYVPLPGGNRNGPEFIVSQHNEYPTKRLIGYKDTTSSLVAKTLTESLENTKEKVKFVTSITDTQNNETEFFIISAQTEDGDHQYIYAKDKRSGDLEYISKIR